MVKVYLKLRARLLNCEGGSIQFISIVNLLAYYMPHAVVGSLIMSSLKITPY